MSEARMEAEAAVSPELRRLTQDVKEMVIERLQLEAEPEDIEDQELLFGGSLDLDSITMLELVAGLEERYRIEVEDEDITPEMLESARSLAEYVLRKRGEEGVGQVEVEVEAADVEGEAEAVNEARVD